MLNNIVTKFRSPNFNERPGDISIDTIVIHYTEINFTESLARLCNPEYKVSTHYLIKKNGTIYNLVAEENRAWHAGQSYWRGKENINDFSIGIELDNNGKENFSSPLMKSLIILCQYLINKYQIKRTNIVGHSDIAPDRKIDPGRLFNWKMLAENGIGYYPRITKNANNRESDFEIKEIQLLLKKIGYKVSITDVIDEQTNQAIKAFCDRWYRDNLYYDNNQELYKLLNHIANEL